MWFTFSLVYILVSATSSFSYGFNVESLPTMVAKEIADIFCENELKKYGMEKNTQFMDLCRGAPIPFLHGVEGFKRGLEHCKENFKCHRWNCTTDEDHGFKLFGTGMARASRESAIMIAMTSAGIVEHVTNQYDSGKRDRVRVSRDDCIKINSRRPRHPEEYVSVHDCNADVVKGEIQAQKMMTTWIQGLKANEKEMKMNEHNAAVGRMAVRVNMRKICKCVGLSGACNARLCFQRMKQLDVSTKWLRHRYDNAQKVQASKRAKRDGTRPLVTVERSATPAKDDLIYLLNSPNYCNYDTSTGSLGTKGRFCNRCGNGVGSCDQLCCGRGHQEYQVTRTKACNCSLVEFQMDCQQCEEKLVMYRCK